MDSNKETNLSNGHNCNNIISSSNHKSLINDNPAIQLASVKSILRYYATFNFRKTQNLFESYKITSDS